jgi:hypothetical protein
MDASSNTGFQEPSTNGTQTNGTQTNGSQANGNSNTDFQNP